MVCGLITTLKRKNPRPPIKATPPSPTCGVRAPHGLHGPDVAGGGDAGHSAAGDRGWGCGVQAPFLGLLPVQQDST